VKTPIAVIGQKGEEVDVQALVGEEPQPPSEKEAGAAEASVESAQKSALEGAAPALKETALPAGDGKLPAGVRASPLARKMAEERGIDLQKVEGSGPQGRIVKADIEAYREVTPQAAPAAPPAAAIPAYVPSGEPRQDRRVPLTRLRSAIGRRMTEAKQQIPHFYVTHEYDVAALLEMRKQVNAALPPEEKVSVNDFIVKAVALTLREFPNLNATLDAKQGEVIQHGQINIGVAVAVESGLLTVVCRDADRKTLRQIAAEVRSMAARVRDGKVRSDEIEGSTFSTSNLGMFDVEHFTAIINPPEAAILAIGSAREVPVVANGEIRTGWRMKVTISVDHRVSDGAEGARFLQALAKYLETPVLMFV
jgi:pyruvate dehydrogenase E2 component (dihydrolipoamide acetyltransferase)